MTGTGGDRTDKTPGGRDLMREAQSRTSATFVSKIALWALIALVLAGIVLALAGGVISALS